jgi:hypothetical protein
MICWYINNSLLKAFPKNRQLAWVETAVAQILRCEGWVLFWATHYTLPFSFIPLAEGQLPSGIPGV